ncbi:alpha/beta fold hydrolase [Terrabacter terrigena]|uniref:Alpha/beta fold hydrolase n=1 Tax=Terrabacter terrigena TaxID=574718 RepID=A0ABW3MZ40_9MICO
MDPLEIDGCRVQVTDAGQGPLVLLIHGTAANLWGAVPQILAHNHRVLSYDRRSFGLSAAPPVTSLRRHTDDAASLLERLGGRPATVVGWSAGGLIALDLAATRPDLVGAVVILEAPLSAKTHPRPELLAGVFRAKFSAARGRDRQGAEYFLRWALIRRGEGNDLDRLPAPWRDAMLANASSILGEIEAGTGERELGRRAIAGITCPVLWLTGDRSAKSFSAAARRTNRKHPNIILVPVQGSGHVIQHDRPDAVVEAVRSVEAMAAS